MIRHAGLSIATLALVAGLGAPADATPIQDQRSVATDAKATNSLILSSPEHVAILWARGDYSHRKNKITVINITKRRRKAVVAYKVKRSTPWRKAERCWAPKANEAATCKVRKSIRENKKVRWRLCLGLYAKKRKNQHINFGPKWCTGSYYFRK